MRKRGAPVDEPAPREVTIPFNVVSEQVVIAAALADVETRVALARRLQPDHFLLEQHKAAWSIVQEMVRQRLDYDPATFQVLAEGRSVSAEYVVGLAELRPDLPPNLEHHVDLVFWDRTRASAAQGPVAGLLEALRNPRELPERVRALARQVAGAFDGAGDRRHLLDLGAIVQSKIAEVRMRVAGHACFPYGLDGLDYFEDGRRRVMPGAAPGLITVITGTSGSGKSTFTANIVLGMMRQRRRVAYGAWEMNGGTTLELLACIDLGWSRSDLIEGRIPESWIPVLERRMREIGQWVTFIDNPFRRVMRERASNERNLDLVQGILAESGCEVFVADLWKRCLVDASPEAEEEALYRQQAMAAELGQHHILCHQQRLKDIEGRADKRPTREGNKGSSAWVDVADEMFGTHRPAQWKKMADDKFQVLLLKQRYGRWPLAVEFDWDGDLGKISGGVSIDYDQPGEGALDGDATPFRSPLRDGGRRPFGGGGARKG